MSPTNYFFQVSVTLTYVEPTPKSLATEEIVTPPAAPALLLCILLTGATLALSFTEVGAAIIGNPSNWVAQMKQVFCHTMVSYTICMTCDVLFSGRLSPCS